MKPYLVSDDLFIVHRAAELKRRSSSNEDMEPSYNISQKPGFVGCVGFNRRRELPPRPVYVGKGNPTAAIGHTPARSQIIHMLSRRETFRQYVGNPLHGSTDESEIHNPPRHAVCVFVYKIWDESDSDALMYSLILLISTSQY